MLQVLLVDSDKQFAGLLVESLVGVAKVQVARNAQEAIDWLDQPKRVCDLLICELALGEHSGVEIIHELRSHNDWLTVPVLIHSRVARAADLTEAHLQKDYGVIGYIHKGSHSVDLIRDALKSLQSA